MIEITTTTKLSVKELAGPLGRGVGYVYRMRMAGFPMELDQQTRCLVTTVEKARRWIQRNRFRLVKGKPVKQQRRKGAKAV